MLAKLVDVDLPSAEADAERPPCGAAAALVQAGAASMATGLLAAAAAQRQRSAAAGGWEDEPDADCSEASAPSMMAALVLLQACT